MNLRRRLLWVAALGVAVLVVGTAGYWVISEGQAPLLDCLYMTVITITTVGYSEVINLSDKPWGRVFTMFVAISGVGIFLYGISALTAMALEGDLSQSFRRKRMEQRAAKLRDHYIVCGMGRVGIHVARELHATNRPFVAIDTQQAVLDQMSYEMPNVIAVVGDATDSATLEACGVRYARGLFAVTGDDNDNVVISLIAKDLNQNARVVARCADLANVHKVRRAGADSVVSPSLIGGLRMASEMLRPATVDFLDTMLRDTDQNLRVEEVIVPPAHVGKRISAVPPIRGTRALLLAVKSGDEWTYNPPSDYVLQAEDALIVMATPEDRDELDKLLHGKGSAKPS